MKLQPALRVQIVAMLIAALALVVSLSLIVTRLSPMPRLQPGDDIAGMRLTTGAVTAPPLWAFCSPGVKTDGVVHVECQVPALPRLAIGHTFRVADQALQAMDWEALAWELTLDGQALDVQAFGLHEFAIPELAPWPSSVREIFKRGRAWDVVLINPTPGAHTLSGVARAETATYRWVVNFTVETDSRLNSARVAHP